MHCRACEYPLWNLSEPRCPECGTGFELGEFYFDPGSAAFACPVCGTHHGGEPGTGRPRTTSVFICSGCEARFESSRLRVVPLRDPPIAASRSPHRAPPWERRESLGRFHALLQTWLMALHEPRALGAGCRRTALPGLKSFLVISGATLAAVLGVGVIVLGNDADEVLPLILLGALGWMAQLSWRWFRAPGERCAVAAAGAYGSGWLIAIVLWTVACWLLLEQIDDDLVVLFWPMGVAWIFWAQALSLRAAGGLRGWPERLTDSYFPPEPRDPRLPPAVRPLSPSLIRQAIRNPSDASLAIPYGWPCYRQALLGHGLLALNVIISLVVASLAAGIAATIAGWDSWDRFGFTIFALLAGLACFWVVLTNTGLGLALCLLTHPLLQMTGPTRWGYRATARAAALGHRPLTLGAIPVVGLALLPVAWIAALVSITRTVRAVQEVELWRAVVAVWFVPLVGLVAGTLALCEMR